MGKRGSHRSDTTEEYVIQELAQLVALSVQDRDCLPGSVVKLLKQAKTILSKRRRVST